LLIDADPVDVERALWSGGMWSRAWSGSGLTVSVGTGGSSAPAAAAQPAAGASGSGVDRLLPGTVIRLTGRRRLGRWSPSKAGLFRVDEPGPVQTSVEGPPRSATEAAGWVGGPALTGIAGSARGWALSSSAVATGAGCLVTIGATAGGGRWRPGDRARMLRFQRLALGLVALAARREPPPPLVVVAGVIVEDGRVLAACRSYPPEVAGRWECPGGKVEPGESEQGALARELREELGIETEIGERIGPAIRLSAEFVLHAYRARIVEGRPVAREHSEVAWVGADELRSVDWLPMDEPLIEAISILLAHDHQQPGVAIPPQAPVIEPSG
jgi:8-oxo-dGTP diphosphatase